MDECENIFIGQINEIARRSKLVSAIYGKTPRSPEEILRENGIDIIS